MKMIRFCQAAAATMLLCCFGCTKEETAAPTDAVRPVRAIQVADAAEFSKRSFPGRAEATRDVDLSFRVGGPLITKAVDTGDQVTKGQILARIDPRDFEVQVLNIEGQVARVEANLDAMRAGARPEDIAKLVTVVKTRQAELNLAQTEVARLTSLVAQKAATQRDLDSWTERKISAESKLTAAEQDLQIGKLGARKEDILAKEAEIRSLKASLAAAKDSVSDTYLRAPFAGEVAATFVDNFQNVRSKQPIVRVLDTSRIEMTVDVPESLISKVRPAAAAIVTFDAFSGRQFDAVVKDIGSEASATTRTFPVTLIMDQPEDVRVLPGMAGKAVGKNPPPDILKEMSGIEVPLNSLISPNDPSKNAVWVIANGTTANKREVKTGRLTDHGIIITDGLKPGEWVATAGASYLNDGQTVRILGQQEADK